MAPRAFDRTSTQLILGVAIVAFLCNAAVSLDDGGLPWEATLAGACTFGVVFGAYYAQKTEVALSIVATLAVLLPTYAVYNAEVPIDNWSIGSAFPLSATKGDVLVGAWKLAPNTSRWDALLPAPGLSVAHLSLLHSGLAVRVNTSEVYHSGLALTDSLTQEKTHDYLLLSSPRKVRRRVESIMLLARVHVRYEVWPKEQTDYSFDLMTAAQIVAPPTLTGELVKLDKGPAIVSLQNKHNLRPFMLDVYKVDWFDHGDR